MLKLNSLDKLSDEYLRAVGNNMNIIGGSKVPVTVRFGVTGKGVSPNYQIEGPQGVLGCFRGSNHERFTFHNGETFFNDKNLSISFLKKEVLLNR